MGGAPLRASNAGGGSPRGNDEGFGCIGWGGEFRRGGCGLLKWGLCRESGPKVLEVGVRDEGAYAAGVY
jgi:hypothetical protein